MTCAFADDLRFFMGNPPGERKRPSDVPSCAAARSCVRGFPPRRDAGQREAANGRNNREAHAGGAARMRVIQTLRGNAGETTGGDAG